MRGRGSGHVTGSASHTPPGGRGHEGGAGEAQDALQV